MVSRSEIDLFNSRNEFKEAQDDSLHEFIQVETMIVSQSLTNAPGVFVLFLSLCEVFF